MYNFSSSKYIFFLAFTNFWTRKLVILRRKVLFTTINTENRVVFWKCKGNQEKNTQFFNFRAEFFFRAERKRPRTEPSWKSFSSSQLGSDSSLIATFFCHPPWGSIEFKRKIEISSHDKERRDWNLHLKHENHVKMERDFLYQLSSQWAHRSFFLISYYILFHMAQWVAPEHLKCTLRHKLQPDYPPFMMILTLLAFLLWFHIQFYIQLLYKPHLRTGILLFGPFGQSSQ